MNKSFRSLIYIVLVITFFVKPSYSKENYDAIVFIKDASSGTINGHGTVIYPGDFIITAAHNLFLKKNIIVESITQNKEEKSALIYAVDYENDLAILKLKDKWKSFVYVSKRSPSINQDVLTIQSVFFDKKPFITRGYISSIDRKDIYTIMEAQHGSSGAPLLNKDGELIGVLSGQLSKIGGMKATNFKEFNISVLETLEKGGILPIAHSARIKYGDQDKTLTLEDGSVIYKNDTWGGGSFSSFPAIVKNLSIEAMWSYSVKSSFGSFKHAESIVDVNGNWIAGCGEDTYNLTENVQFSTCHLDHVIFENPGIYFLLVKTNEITTYRSPITIEKK